MIIEFGRWQLRPSDSRNWQLYVRKRPDYRGKHLSLATAGQKADIWASVDRYYQWNTIPNAIVYAASRDLMDKEGTVDALEFAREFEAMIDEHLAAVTKAWGNYTDPTAKTPCRSNDAPQTGK